ncbi:SRPBCC family protein [Haloechinothrix sp. YIM 98757]|uniref:SRPBCC family protein n=1 Tax=Haloechinothrix aidingensis TaxID=2752311 RepID=A0A838AC00_9PSEU|nr:SRPBCC family protein [Haloechinothrix aidingensis]MBA0126757.1 SRPBCC family protein [Haloechinothrix aidingensis]
MSNVTTRATFVSAPPDKVAAVITDLESYPSWQKEMQYVEILTKDDQSRPVKVRFDISAMGQEASYTAVFSYPEEGVIESHLLEGDMITKQDQRYVLSPTNDGTEVSYTLELDVKWQVPDVMLKAIINKGIKTNLDGIKKRSET